jgi:prophage maintenance system killer protein
MANDKKSIIFLEVEHLIDVNDIIRQKAKDEKDINCSGEEAYPIEFKKLQALIEHVPKRDVLGIATYYLRNIILLQPFPDGNHRTGLASAEFFLNKNGYGLSYTAEEALEFQKEAYRVRLETYGNYDQHDVGILKTNKDDFSHLCRSFIERGLTKHD